MCFSRHVLSVFAKLQGNKQARNALKPNNPLPRKENIFLIKGNIRLIVLSFSGALMQIVE